MPFGMLRPCPGCGRTVSRGWCDACKAKRPPRVSAARRGYGRRWQKIRRAKLDANPTCADTYERHPGVVTLATDVDHIIACTPDMSLFWDTKNHQSLCHDCHSYKTVTIDGGFGNEKLRKSLSGEGDRGVENISIFGL